MRSTRAAKGVAELGLLTITTMKRLAFIIFLTSMLVLVYVVWSHQAPRSPSTIVIREASRATNNPLVSLCFSNPTSSAVFVQVDSIDYQVGGEWIQRQPVPKGLAPGLPTVVAPHQWIVTSVTSPTNFPWKLRVQCVERRHTDMIVDRLFSLFTRSRTANFRGTSYLTETTEITH